MIQETRRVALAFAVRPEDISTGRPAWPVDGSLRVFSGDGLSRALPKDDGYFIFTGTRPDNIRITSRIYEDVSFAPDDCSVNVLRVSLIPRKPVGRCVFLPLTSGECAHIGFYGEKAGYALLPETAAGSLEITLNKDDYAELTGLFHAIIHGEAHEFISGTKNTLYTKQGANGVQLQAAFVGAHLGYGRYRLSEPFPSDYPIRGTRLLPLFRIVGNGGDLRIPVPDGSLGAYLLRNGDLEKISMEEWG